MATECRTRSGFVFQPRLTVDFEGGAITGDAGLLLLRELDERLGLTRELGKIVRDDRDRRYVTHEVVELLRQRIYQIAAGYEDANDATFLRDDPTFRALVRRKDLPLASQPTLSRFENSARWESIRQFERQGTEWLCRHGFGRSVGEPEELILDVDSTDDPTHGAQQLSFFNGFYDTYMYHPILVFEGSTGILLGSRLRAGDVSGTAQLLPLLAPIVTRLRERFPGKAIAIRGDGDFCKPDLLDAAEEMACLYAVGMPRNPRLEERIEPLRERAERLWEKRGTRVRLYTSFFYQTRSWDSPRRVLAKVERTAEGRNVRFVVTNRTGSAEEIFRWYEQRGQAENFIKDFKRDVAADRLSCSAYRANAFRLQLHALAYNLLVFFRRLALRGTELARATIQTVRLRLFKAGARVRRTARRLWIHLATGWPGQPVFVDVAERLTRIRGPT